MNLSCPFYLESGPALPITSTSSKKLLADPGMATIYMALVAELNTEREPLQNFAIDTQINLSVVHYGSLCACYAIRGVTN
jgi:hypothetical protein